MYSVLIRNAFSIALSSGVIGFYILYGSTPLHAQGVSLANVDAGQCETDDVYTIAIHGGLTSLDGNHETKTSYLKPLLGEARSSLASGARAIHVVEAVISRMEDSGHYNAGKGGIANQDGVVELDASIMDGRELKAGSVAAVTSLRNPITAARLVMDKSEHVMIVGPNADSFARDKGGSVVDDAYFLYGGMNFSDVPLPADLAITPADENVSSDKVSFLGAWGGVSSEGDLNHILVVEEIQDDRAKVIYALGKYPVWGEGLYRRLDGVFVQSELKIKEPTDLGGYTLLYSLNSNDTLTLTATHPSLPNGKTVMTRQHLIPASDNKSGTVGAVVRDRCGDLAAGTSTGGYRAKTPGRVGDSPILGAGTYADNETAAVSAAGHGEFFMRYVVAYDITAMMKYTGSSVEDAATNLIKQKLRTKGLRGGVIAVDHSGNYVMTYNSDGMIRGVASNSQEPIVAVH
jgi:beta-aspartyl-peptidase (threonine type)